MAQQMELTKLSSYNLDELKRISDGDNEFVADILRTVAVSCPEVIQSVQKHYQSGDLTSLAFVLHKFKSTVHVLDNSNLTALVSNLEIMAKQQLSKESLETDLETLIQAVGMLSGSLTMEIQKLN